jgi:hypothetical protein
VDEQMVIWNPHRQSVKSIEAKHQGLYFTITAAIQQLSHQSTLPGIVTTLRRLVAVTQKRLLVLVLVGVVSVSMLCSGCRHCGCWIQTSSLYTAVVGVIATASWQCL